MAFLIEFGSFEGPDGVELDVAATATGRHVRIVGQRDLRGLATGWFSRTSVHVPIVVTDAEPSYLGYAFTQFALPVVAGPARDFDFRPAPNLHSPPAVGLLLVRGEGRTALVAPLTHVHEQIISLEGGELRWGWHGDLDEVPAGFDTIVGVYEGASATDVFAAWVHDLTGGAAVERPRGRNPLTSHLSYWTDNGAAYWYRTEPGRSIGGSITDVVRSLHDLGVAVRAVELDSWFYQHEVPRPIAEIGYPEEVPPSGAMRWEPRGDAFDTTIDEFSDELGRPPLVLHARHISPASPYLAEGEWWTDALAAHPVNPEFFERWFADAARWGACCIEQDWMLMYWFGVRALRAAPGRAMHWQTTLDRLAGEHGLGLVWCMATPADMIAAASLTNIVAVRTSDDYRFAADPALLWTWYLTVNRLAGALGLPAFKDVFFSQRPEPGADSIDGDEHAELEALLSALSAGAVGIGDRIGHTDREIVLRTCDIDGRLRHVDRPVALVDDCLFGEPARGERLAWATARATVDGDVWTYVVAINTSVPAVVVDDGLSLASLGIDESRSTLEWRTGAVRQADSLRVALAPRDWAYYVVAPPGRRADDGDLRKYVTVPSQRP
jgi:hypothetical protein